MPLQTTVRFVALDAPQQKAIVLFAPASGALGTAGAKLDTASGGAIGRAMAASDFQGKPKSTVEVLGASGITAQRVIVVGTGIERSEADRLALGGAVQAALAGRKLTTASIIVETGADATVLAADMALGAVLRGYAFDVYKSKGKDEASSNGDGDNPPPALPLALTFHVADPTAAETAFATRRALADGVALARDLTNEPANILGPVEFASRLSALSADGLHVEVMDEARLRELKMGALLSVSQGSARRPESS